MMARTEHQLPVFGKSVYSLLLLIAVAIVYGNFLHNPEVFDDKQFFMYDKTIEHFRGFHPFEIRWLPDFTIAATTYFSLNVIWFRLESLLLHAATGIALFFFLDRLFDLVLAKTKAGTVPHVWIAFFGALFFLWHPVAVYGAAYLIERTIVMATLFSLLTLYVYMRGLTEKRPRWLWASVGLYLLAVFSKEHAVMLPAVMLALTMLLETPSRALVRRLLPIYVVCGVIALYVAMQKLGLLGSVYEVGAHEMLHKVEAANPHEAANPYPLSVLTQSFLFFKYLFLWLVPNPAWMSIDMREPFAESLFSSYLLAMLAFLAYGSVAIRLLLKRGALGLLGFAMLFPWLMFATEFATVRIQELFVLYRSYLWMVGIFAALPLLLRQIPFRLALYGMLACAITLAAFSVNRLITFSNPFLLWDDALVLVGDRQDLPGVSRIYHNRGRSLVDLKRYQESLADYRRAVELDPESLNNHYSLGVGLMNVNRYAEAIKEFDIVIKARPKYLQARLGRGLSNLELGNKAAALPDLEINCEHKVEIACKKIKAINAEKQLPH